MNKWKVEKHCILEFEALIENIKSEFPDAPLTDAEWAVCMASDKYPSLFLTVNGELMYIRKGDTIVYNGLRWSIQRGTYAEGNQNDEKGGTK